MVNFGNLLDAAITQANDTIRQVMRISATVTPGAISGVMLSGVFDDPENIGYATPGTRVERTNPLLFAKLATTGRLARPDSLDINGKPFWANRTGPDDCGSCHIWSGTDSPPTAIRHC